MLSARLAPGCRATGWELTSPSARHSTSDGRIERSALSSQNAPSIELTGNCSTCFITYSARRPLPLGLGRKRRSFLLDGVLARFDGDEPAAEGDGRQTATVDWFGPLGDTLVGFVGMQAEALFLAIIAAHRAASIPGMLDDGSPLEAKGLRPPIGLADAALGCFQSVQLAAMELVRHPIPDPGAGGRCRSTGGGGQHPGIDRMTVEGLRIFLAGLDEA